MIWLFTVLRRLRPSVIFSQQWTSIALLSVLLLAAGWPAVNSSLPGSSGQILYNNSGVPGAKTLACSDLSDAGSGCTGTTSSGGTVTSIATGFGLTGGPITGSGTIARVAPSTDDQIEVSDSSSGATWRTLTDCTGTDKALTYATSSNTFGCNTIASTPSGAALTKTDDTNVTLTLGGTPTTALLQATSLTMGWSGQLGLARGGTHADLSATGGTSQVLKQVSSGANITVARLACSDLSDAGSGCTGTTSSGGTVTSVATGAGLTGGTITSTGTIALTTSAKTRSFGAAFDGGGVALTTGSSLPFQVPYACTISAYSISVTTADTATFKTWRVATGTAIPTSGNSISSLGVSIASGTHVRSTTVTDWTSTAISANDIVIIQLSSVGGTTQGATFQVECTLS
jgi:hypothetical protein